MARSATVEGYKFETFSNIPTPARGRTGPRGNASPELKAAQALPAGQRFVIPVPNGQDAKKFMAGISSRLRRQNALSYKPVVRSETDSNGNVVGVAVYHPKQS